MKKKGVWAMIMAATLAIQSPLAVCAAGELWLDSESDDTSQTFNENVTVSEDRVSAVGTEGDGVELNVQGDVSYSGKLGSGVLAIEGSSTNVKGNITTSGDGSNGAEAGNGGVVTVIGSIKVTGANIDENDNDEDNKGADGILTYDGGSVKVTGNVSSVNGAGAAAYGESNDIRVEGNVTSDNGTGAVADGNNSMIDITGDIKSGSEGTVAVNGGNIQVGGNIVSNDAGVIVGNSEQGSDNASISVGGDVSADTAVIVSSGANAEVKGDVTGKTTGVNTDNKSTVVVSGDVISKNGTAIVIDINASSGNGKIIVEGTVSSGNNDSSIYISKTENTNVSGSDLINALPKIVVGELASNVADNYLWNYYDDELNDDNEDKGALNEQILKEKIQYIIGIKNPTNGSIDVSGDVSTEENYLVACEEGNLTVTVKANEGYEVTSVSGGKATVTRNEDGTYSIVVPRGGGIDISAVIKAISAVETARSENSDSGDSKAAVQPSVYAAVQKEAQEEFAKLSSTDRTYTIEMKEVISFNRKSFEAFASRPDVEINIIYTYQGHRYLVVIPAGYPVMDLLDENGYCGCLYLNAVFGSQLID